MSQYLQLILKWFRGKKCVEWGGRKGKYDKVLTVGCLDKGYIDVRCTFLTTFMKV